MKNARVWTRESSTLLFKSKPFAQNERGDSSRFRIIMHTFECPICHTVSNAQTREEASFRPFCSERCKLIDLGRWLDGTYLIKEPMTAENVEELFPEAEQ